MSQCISNVQKSAWYTLSIMEVCGTIIIYQCQVTVIFFPEVSHLLLTTRLRGMHLCIPYFSYISLHFLNSLHFPYTDEENEAQKNVIYQVYTGKRDQYHNLIYPYYVPFIS